MLSVIVIVLGCACMVLAGQVAERRGRSGRAWMWLGMVFGPFALVAVVLLPARRGAATA